MADINKRDEEKVPTDKPSFSSTEDEPLATAGTGGSEDPKGRVRPGGGEVPSDSSDQGSAAPAKVPDESKTPSD